MQNTLASTGDAVDHPEFLTVDEAAAVLRISRSHAYWLASTGQLPGVVRLGRVIRVRADALFAQGGVVDA